MLAMAISLSGIVATVFWFIIDKRSYREKEPKLKFLSVYIFLCSILLIPTIFAEGRTQSFITYFLFVVVFIIPGAYIIRCLYRGENMSNEGFTDYCREWSESGFCLTFSVLGTVFTIVGALGYLDIE